MLRKKSIEDEWFAMQDQIELLKLLNSDVFVFADISGSIQADSIDGIMLATCTYTTFLLILLTKKDPNLLTSEPVLFR